MVLLCLTPTLDGVGGQRHVPADLPQEKRPDTHRTGYGAGPSVGLDGCGISRPHRDSIHGAAIHRKYN